MGKVLKSPNEYIKEQILKNLEEIDRNLEKVLGKQQKEEEVETSGECEE